MADEPENLVLQLLRGLRAEMATKAELADVGTELGEFRAELKADMGSLRADVASDLAAMQAQADAEHKATRKQVGDQVAGLRRALVEYHSVVIGLGR